MDKNKAFRYLKRIFSHALISRTSQNLPTILSYLITDQCNSHCITCNVWRMSQNRSLSSDTLLDTLSDPLFKEIRHVGISGGEPSLSADLIMQVHVLVAKLPKLETISITSNCIHAGYWEDHLKEILSYCHLHKIYFQFNVSLDGIGELHDRIRGVRGNFENADRMITYLIEHKIPFQIHSTVNRYNVYHVNALLKYARERRAEIIFRLASEIHRLENSVLMDRIALNMKQKSFFCDFLDSVSLLSYTKSPGRRLYYHYLRKQLLTDGKRQSPCYFKSEGLVLSSDGSLAYCSRFTDSFTIIGERDNMSEAFVNTALREKCITKHCEYCYHDQTGYWPLHTVLKEISGKRLIRCLKFFQILRYWFLSSLYRKKTAVDKEIRSVAIIGMYGGEHLGDAAILGGVVLRLKERYPNLEHVHVFSFRKDRTQMWVDSLIELNDLSFTIHSDEKLFSAKIIECQLLVWAGGPLMEIPVIISRNYYFMRQALALGIGVELEGIGYGPVSTNIGKFMLHKCLKVARRITARSSGDARRINEICQVENSGHYIDPAFDYLARIPSPVPLTPKEKEEVDRLLNIGVERKLIALNLRPLWHRYGKNLEFDFEHFLDEMTVALKELSLNNYTTLFFPMNSDQFGFSDLEVAYKLRDRLGNDFPHYKIWETEPTINQVIYLLRNMDAAICMRFHAAIFSLSQGVKTIGIDYSLSGRGKVFTLFENQENCLPICEISAWSILKQIL